MEWTYANGVPCTYLCTLCCINSIVDEIRRIQLTSSSQHTYAGAIIIIICIFNSSTWMRLVSRSTREARASSIEHRAAREAQGAKIINNYRLKCALSAYSLALINIIIIITTAVTGTDIGVALLFCHSTHLRETMAEKRNTFQCAMVKHMRTHSTHSTHSRCCQARPHRLWANRLFSFFVSTERIECVISQ